MTKVDRNFVAAPTATGKCNVSRNHQAAPAFFSLRNVDKKSVTRLRAGSAGINRDGWPLRRSEWQGSHVLDPRAAAQQELDSPESSSSWRSGWLRYFKRTVRFKLRPSSVKWQSRQNDTFASQTTHNIADVSKCESTAAALGFRSGRGTHAEPVHAASQPDIAVAVAPRSLLARRQVVFGC